jgi:hypothetical protein
MRRSRRAAGIDADDAAAEVPIDVEGGATPLGLARHAEQYLLGCLNNPGFLASPASQPIQAAGEAQ